MQQSIDQVRAAFNGTYTIERELGAGGMATVYLARDHKHDRDVAIKVLHPEPSASLGRERFLREIHLAARLSHPHILPLFDSGEAAGALYYVMPRVRGKSLRDRLNEVQRLPVAEAVRIALEVAGALDHAHRQGVVHRDIKPENILLQDGLALVMDFGIGKAVSDAAADTLTQSGLTIGTPAYMSPEQAVGEAVDGRSDLYSLGCVVYEMLTGEPPFTGRTVQAVIAKRFVQVPADVAALREGIPRPVARAVQRLLQRTAVDRHGSAAELVEALRDVDTTELPRATAPARSIAVLPFVNLSPDRENEYIGDGIAEDIIGLLAAVDGLQVAARMSAFSFKGRALDLTEIGGKLNVAAVLDGSVRRSGGRIRITAQLTDVADGYQRWSERYDRELTDVFAVQDEIAGAIAERLQLTLAPRERESPKATTADVQAHELESRARALVAQRGGPILEAIGCLERAVALSPNRASAWALLGNGYRVRAQYGLGTVAECHPLAYAALDRALTLEPDNAEAMGHLAVMRFNETPSKRDEYLPLFERALELDPRLSEIRGLYGGWALAVVGRGKDDERALREVRRSVADDPLNPICSTIYAVAMGILGRPAEGAAEVQRACDLNPEAFGPRYMLLWSQVWMRDTDGAMATARTTLEKFGRHPWVLQVLTGVYMQQGDQRRAEAVHAELVARAVTSNVSLYTRAVSALYLGRTDEALEYAIESARTRDAIGQIWYRWPDLEALQAHPRFGEVLDALEARAVR